MSNYDTDRATYNREEALAEIESPHTSHDISTAVIGSWKVDITEVRYDDTGNLKERSWMAWRPSLEGQSKQEEMHEDDLLGLIETMIHVAENVGWKDHYDAYKIMADLMNQANEYWNNYNERGSNENN